MVEHIKNILRESVNRKDPSYARNNLTEEEKDYIFNNLDLLDKFTIEEKFDYIFFQSIIFSIYTKEQAKKRLLNIEKMNLIQKISIICCLPNDEMKLEKLFTGHDNEAEVANAYIISSLSSDELKVQSLSNLSADSSKASVISSFVSDELKVQSLSNLSADSGKASVISSFASDELKIQSLSKLSADSSKARVISSFASDELKIQSLSKLSDDYNKASVISSFTSDELKVQSLSKLSDDYSKASVISSFTSDELKIQSLSKLSADSSKAIVISSFTSDELKVQSLSKLSDDYSKTSIISSFTSDELKVQSLSKINADSSKASVISSFVSDELKIQSLSKLNDDYSKARVISSFAGDELKIQSLSKLSADSSKAIVISSFASDELKIQSLSKLSADYNKASVISSFTSDELKVQSLSLLSADSNKLKVIKDLTSDELKLKGLISIKEDENILNFINSLGLKTENQKLNILNYISQNSAKFKIVSEFSKENLKEGLNYLTWFEKERDKGMGKKLKILEEYKKILQGKNSQKSIDSFIDCIERNQECLDEKSITQIAGVLHQFDISNSLELSNLKQQIAPLVLSSSNPIESFNKIEKIFLKNNLPMFGKEFLCFQILYPEFQKEQGEEKIFDFTEGSRISPELLHPTQTRKMKVVSKNATDKDIRFQIVFNDLLRIASRSNNRSLIEYLNNIEYGNTLFLGISKGIIKFNDLDDKSKQILDVFSNHLAALYENTKKGSEEILENLSTAEKIAYFSRKFNPTSRYDLPDRIVRSFAYQAGIESFEQFKNIVINSVREKEEVSKKRSEELKNGKKLVLEPGDFVRGIGNIDCVESSLNNGNVCKEFLGTFLGKSDSDSTPLDVDLTLITKENTDIYHNIEKTPTGFGFGNVYVILKKGNPNLNITRDKEGNLTGNEYAPSKVEVFGTSTQKGGYETHWGARTGIASSDIDYILFKEDLTIDPSNPYSGDGKVNYILPELEFEKNEYYGKHQNDLAILKNEVVKNGFYIPIVDFSGKIIFTDEEYQELKQKMEGLSHYGSKEYHLEQHQYSDYTERIKGLLASNKQETKIQSQKVYQALSDIIQSIPMDENSTKTLQAKNKIGIDLTPGSVEVLETGSSVRGTNVPYDFDFDYIFRLDSNIINDDKKMHQFRTKICEALNIASVPSGDFRDVEATIPGLGTIKLDITFIQKNDKVEYSTEMALQDRMDTIYKSNPAAGDEVTANIILAKLLLKQAGCYKPERKDPNQGGLGGVGIENWITQNGGTLETAANSFLKASEGKTYEEFKQIYHIHDYGKNHLYKEKNKYPYDDFVFNNMNRIGYQKMQEVLRKYIRYLSGEKDLFPELEEVLNALEQQQEKEVTITHSRGIVSFFILISLSLLISIITIIYILLRK